MISSLHNYKRFGKFAVDVVSSILPAKQAHVVFTLTELFVVSAKISALCGYRWQGMEFASNPVLIWAQDKQLTTELPTTLYLIERVRSP